MRLGPIVIRVKMVTISRKGNLFAELPALPLGPQGHLRFPKLLYDLLYTALLPLHLLPPSLLVQSRISTGPVLGWQVTVCELKTRSAFGGQVRLGYEILRR